MSPDPLLAPADVSVDARRDAVGRRAGRWGVPILAAAILAVSVVWGWAVQSDPNTKLGAAPLVGQWRARYGPSLLIAAAIATLVVTRGARVIHRWPFARVVVGGAVTAVAFTFTLAASDGLGHVLDPVVHPTEYWANLATLPPAGEMVRRYDTIGFLLNFSVHAKGHPPGFLLVLKALGAIGLGHPWAAGALSYIGVGVVVAAVAVTVRIVAGEHQARSLVPFLALAPYSVWMGTSADAFYAAVAGTGVVAVVAAVRAEAPATRRLGALAGGAVLAAALFLTYGAAILLLLPLVLVVALGWRHWRALGEVIGLAAAGAATVVVAFALGGFWWFDGAATTKTFYWWGTAQFRPAGYFAVGNLGAAIIACGPAVVVALGRRRPAAVWWIVGGALACIAVADASQYSKAEVERIWLLFYPWLVPAAVVLRRRRLWLAAQATLAIGLQLMLVSKW